MLRLLDFCLDDHVLRPLQIIRRANDLGEDPLSLSDRFCQEYLDDMDALQCLLPTHQPRVSEHMEQIKDMISQVLSLSYMFMCACRNWRGPGASHFS